MSKRNVILAITVAITLAGCGSNPTSSPPSNTEPTSSDQTLQTAGQAATTSAEPPAAQRGLSAADVLTIKGALTLGVNASGYAGSKLELETNRITANGNRLQTGTRARCKDASGQGFCTGSKALEQVDLQSVLAPDVQAIANANAPTGGATLNGSVKIDTAQQLAEFLASAGTGVRINGNLSVNVPAEIGATTISVTGQANFPQGLKVNGTKLLANKIELGGLTLNGKSLLLARNELELKGTASSTTDATSQLIAGQSIKVDRSSTGRLTGVLWAGKDIRVEGTLEVTGGVLSGDKVEVDQTGTLTVNVRNPLERLAENLGGEAALAAFLDGADAAAIGLKLAEYGPKLLREAAPSGALRAQSATDCVESTATNPRITSAANTVVQPAGVGNGSYSVDSLGRPYQGVKTVAKPAVATARTSAVSTCSADVGRLGITGDQGGHLIGLQYGGWGLRLNLAPQWGSFNTGNWVQLENAIAKCGNLPSGKTASVTVTITFGSTTTNRPDTFKMTVSITGASAITGSFSNDANSGSGGQPGTGTRTTMVNSITTAGCV